MFYTFHSFFLNEPFQLVIIIIIILCMQIYHCSQNQIAYNVCVANTCQNKDAILCDNSQCKCKQQHLHNKKNVTMKIKDLVSLQKEKSNKIMLNIFQKLRVYIQKPMQKFVSLYDKLSENILNHVKNDIHKIGLKIQDKSHNENVQQLKFLTGKQILQKNQNLSSQTNLDETYSFIQHVKQQIDQFMNQICKKIQHKQKIIFFHKPSKPNQTICIINPYNISTIQFTQQLIITNMNKLCKFQPRTKYWNFTKKTHSLVQLFLKQMPTQNKFFKNLKILNLNKNDLTDQSILQLKQFDIPKLTEIKLIQNCISDKGCDYLINTKWPQLSYINLSGNQLKGSSVMKSFIDYYSERVWRLDLDYNYLSSNENWLVDYIINKEWKKLSQIHLYGNKLQQNNQQKLQTRFKNIEYPHIRNLIQKKSKV